MIWRCDFPNGIDDFPLIGSKMGGARRGKWLHRWKRGIANWPINTVGSETEGDPKKDEQEEMQKTKARNIRI